VTGAVAGQPGPVDVLDEALAHLDVLRRHVDEAGMDDELGFDAASLRLSVAIDCVTRLPLDLQDVAYGDQRSAIRAMRNRIAHGYFWIDPDVVRDTVTHDLDPFEHRLRGLRRMLSAEA
jgi:uncharacterized protein with HEPN domain